MLSIYDFIYFFVFILLLFVIPPFLGSYIFKLYQSLNIKTGFEWLERFTYRIINVDSSREMHWREYVKALLVFNLFGFLFLFILLVTQQWLPGNPENFGPVPYALAFNTAISFVTNTNWQAYSGESTLSYTTQMMGLTVQNFLSAGTGAATAFVLMRGVTRKESGTVGNFWNDLVKVTLYLLLPLSLILAFVLVSQGVIQNFSAYVSSEGLDGFAQKIPMGPVASQVAIKQLGTNGGGYFGANSAHPFENPNPLTNFLEVFAILLVPAAFIHAYGRAVESAKHGWLIFLLMFLFWMEAVGLSLFANTAHNTVLDVYPVLEGVETRFGLPHSIMWAVSTTATSSGSVNAMLSSLSPIAGGFALLNIMLGEVVFGGVGVGLCSIIMFVLLTVFLSGLMVGRTPEYLGKKIEKKEIQWVMIAVLVPGILILLGAGISSILPAALSSLGNQGPHGLSEILYAFSSAAGNNGSAFSGLNANTNYYNVFLGTIMLTARLAIIVPSIAVGGLLASKKVTPTSKGTFSVNSIMFLILLGSVILIVGALTFFPALSLGPIVEHFLMLKGKAF